MPEDEPRTTQGVAAWIQRIRNAEIPIFGSTTEQIVRLTTDESTSVAKLSEIALHDPGLTAKLLRIANSAIFNTSGQHVATVTRTILLLGFNTVREVAISVAMVERFLQGAPRARVLREVGRSFHAATQARWMAAKRRDAAPEEVFVAALLFRFGEIAFWCFAGESGNALEEALRRSPRRSAEAEQEVLGFHLRQLTAGLVREWHLSQLLQNALSGGHGLNSRERGVMLAQRLVEALESGWRSAAAQAQIDAVAEFLQLPVRAVEQAVAANAAMAARVAEDFGAAAAVPLIPLPEIDGAAES
jgi:HD-like signal output (HDOD) protein